MLLQFGPLYSNNWYCLELNNQKKITILDRNQNGTETVTGTVTTLLSMVQNEEDIFAVLVVAQADSFSDRCGIASIELTDKFDGRRSERELLVRNLCFTLLVRRACDFPILWGVK